MKAFLHTIFRITVYMNLVAGIALTFIILLTVCDVLLRALGKPIQGAYEIVAMAGGIVIGFVTPFTSWVRGHIFMDFVIERLSLRAKSAFEIATRCVGVALFLMISWNVFKIGKNLYSVDEVTPTLELPLYPIAYGVGFCFFVLSVVLFCDILKIAGGGFGGDHE
ncbi:MAG TPA: TRAP transporter small permease subunit [Syntrophorhabdales bacterium]|nr:TRAP transporter small permease subunit [Syntrophorhabdales bacterium]